MPNPQFLLLALSLVALSGTTACSETRVPAREAPAASGVTSDGGLERPKPRGSGTKRPAAGARPLDPSPTGPAVKAAKPSRHALWDGVLKAAVTSAGWVDYVAIRERHDKTLRSYLKVLETTRPGELKTEQEQKAFWINAYNAVCVRMILDHEIPASVPKALVFGANIFKEKKYRIAGKIRSLDDIEHGILRVDFRDPRIHATIVCAASSCPRLRNEAYRPDRLEEQLDEEAASWIQRETDKKGKRKNYLERKQKTFYASKIFDWFQEDFGDSEAGVLRFVKKHASASTREFLEKNQVRVAYLPYDWSLNRQG